MIRYAARAVPWSLVAAACALAPVLMAIVAAWPESMWPLQGTAVGVLAGVVAWALDERPASIVDSLPRPHWWRTVARILVVVPVTLAVAIGSLVVHRDRLPDHLPLFVVQAVVAVVLALAVAVWRRSRGVAEPGTTFATYVIPAAAALALIRPARRLAAGLPRSWAAERWALSWGLWLTAGAIGAIAVILPLATDRRA